MPFCSWAGESKDSDLNLKGVSRADQADSNATKRNLRYVMSRSNISILYPCHLGKAFQDSVCDLKSHSSNQVRLCVNIQNLSSLLILQVYQLYSQEGSV